MRLELDYNKLRGMAKARQMVREQALYRSMDEVFEFFSNAENLGRITPDFMNFKIVTPLPIEMKQGAIIDYKIRLYGVPMKWKTHIAEWKWGSHFVDEQQKGPFALWHHLHAFEERDGVVWMKDTVNYRAPLGPLGGLAHVAMVDRTVKKIFDHRFKIVEDLLGPRNIPTTDGLKT